MIENVIRYVKIALKVLTSISKQSRPIARGNNNMNAKEFLRQYEYATYKAHQCREQYQLMMEKIDAIGSTLGSDGMPHGSGVSRKTEQLAIELAEAAQRYLDAERESFNKRQDVYELIRSIDGIEGEVLYQKYIKLLTWEEIANALHYSVRGIQYAHGRALVLVAEKLK